MFFIKSSKSIWKAPSSLETNLISRLYSNLKFTPGTRRRMQLLEDVQELDAENIDFEANFETIHHSHKEHMIELEAQREKLKYDIVKQKYFKNKYPNFLTWHDKEQIRLLHSRDPEEWNVDKLSDGFPALPEVIKKIVKSNWNKKSLAKIRNHDTTVQENWRKLKNNEFKDLPSYLVEHLKKFSGRDLNFNSYDHFKANDRIEFNSTNVSTEFSDIITSYETLKKISSQQNDSKKIEIDLNENSKEKRSNEEEDTYIAGTIKNKHSMTLDYLKNKIENDLKTGLQASYTDIQIVKSIETDTNEMLESAENSSSLNQLVSVKYNTGSIAELDEKSKVDYAHLVYPEKITIPKSILKKGYTYKLNDCYYDSDGQFLYRVPGMC
ncbi:hypothetical protein WA026_007377 [Henosepilachna vigintioctopunctata]|uniref:Neurite outgrowth-associated protein n=1 Tax=Henosepilachna vigintioctopunctata TaxID=420089 RepID=A0AAW1UXI6_9CUCU